MAPKHEKRTIFMKIMAIFGKGVSERERCFGFSYQGSYQKREKK